MRELPSGTVTFLFTDIVGSTRLLNELGDAYANALAQHRRRLRAAVARHGGVEVDTQGDAFFFAFARASDAVAAAEEGRSALEEGSIRVRIGLHTGEPIVTAEGYVGLDVHKAARLAGSAHGGQILLSQATRELLGGQLPVRELGFHRLKDLNEPLALYQLGDREFPPLRAQNASNLPLPPTPLIGRDRELAQAGQLLRAHRLLTLTGPGGSGKTRLALELAAGLLDEFPDGVSWVPLQALREPKLVFAAIAQAVGVEDSVAAAVAGRRMLLLLDNLEQLLPAAPQLAELLAQTPALKLLVTSREPLHLAAEHEYPVGPLRESDAVALFAERARAASPDFEPNDTIAAICRRLDRLPLAIELAAARINALAPTALLQRLDQRLPLLTGGRRDAAPRRSGNCSPGSPSSRVATPSKRPSTSATPSSTPSPHWLGSAIVTDLL